MVRNKSIKVRASEREAEVLKRLAHLHGVTPSEFLRDLLKKAARQAGLLPDITAENQAEEFAIAA